MNKKVLLIGGTLVALPGMGIGCDLALRHGMTATVVFVCIAALGLVFLAARAMF